MILLPRLPQPAADRVLEDFLSDVSSTFDPDRLPDAARFAPTGGTRITPSQLQSLRDGLEEIAVASGFDRDAKSNDLAKFDSMTAAWLADFDHLQDSEALRDDVWAFVAIVIVPDIVQWRFGNTRDRYRGGVRNTLQRLWLRGRILDRGQLARDRWGLLDALTEDAFVQIFERPSLGADPVLARALAEAWVRASARFGKNQMEPIMRRAALRVRVQNEILSITFLTQAKLAELLDQVFDSVSTIGDSSASSG